MAHIRSVVDRPDCADTLDTHILKVTTSRKRLTLSLTRNGDSTTVLTSIGTTTYIASYDADVRLSSLSVSNTSAVLFQSQRGYDAVGNVTAVGAILAADTDNHMFCYDDQHRLTWAGSAGTPNCGASLTPGSLTAANYTQTYTYDTLDRLQSGPLGSYTYGDSAHLHAVTSIANGGTTTYSATYDVGGNMTCRAPSSNTTCSGTPTGAVLSFDNEGRLSAWQNTPTNPTTTDSFLYDGEGNRVEQQTATNGSIITSTIYVAGGLEEITSTGATTTLTKYFGAAGLPTAERVGTNGPLSYLATDGQGTVSETLDGSGNVTSAQLYAPYGSVRYSSGSSPTSMGYTGQRANSATGLDYFNARYYDPAAGQFISADTVDDGLNRYGYVAGNPTTNTDPTGHRLWAGGDSGGGGSNTPPDCHVTNSCKTTSGDGKGGGKGNGKGSGKPPRPCEGTALCSPGTSDGSKSVTVDGEVCYTQECVRATKIDELTRQAGMWLSIGIFVQIAAAVVDWISEGTLGKLERTITIAMLGIQLIAAVFQWIGGSGPAYEFGQKIAAILNWAAQIAVQATAAYRTFGWFAQHAVDAAEFAIQGTIEGLPGAFEMLAMDVFGQAFALALTGGSLFFMGQYNATNAESSHEQHMPISDWCAQYGGGMCKGLPAS